VKPGKGPAFVRSKLKGLRSGKVIENTFTAGVKVTTARIEKRPSQFLYKDDLGYHFMDSNTFEQTNLPGNLIEAPNLMKEGQEVEIVVHAETETSLSCELPQFVELKITYTEPGVKGDTATNTTKPATIETGGQINVPLFINQDEIVRIDTRSGNYVERVK
jgi:elongation factor P